MNKAISTMLDKYFRLYEEFYKSLNILETVGIFQLTGCRKPCRYNKYGFIGGQTATSFAHQHFVFSLWAVSNSTTVETEVFVYPWTSFVAEFGGTLGKTSKTG